MTQGEKIESSGFGETDVQRMQGDTPQGYCPRHLFEEPQAQAAPGVILQTESSGV